MAAKKIILLTLLTLPLAVLAETMDFGPVSFNIPAGWKCQVDGQSMICLDESASTKRNSAVVITFKNKSGEDSLTVYKDQLARPRVLQQGEVATPSQPKGVRELNINGLAWIEGIHYASEMPNYFTHYYATTAFQHAVLVSLSIEDSAHEEMMRILQPTIDSIVIKNTGGHSTVTHQPTTDSAPNPTATTDTATSHKNVISVAGFNIHRNYLFLAVGLILVLGMAIYAIIMK